MKNKIAFLTALVFTATLSLAFLACDNPSNSNNLSGSVLIDNYKTIAEGVADDIIFDITTQDIPNGNNGTLTWYSDSAGKISTETPAGVLLLYGFSVFNNKASVHLVLSGATPAGNYYFRVAFDSQMSAVARLEIIAMAKFKAGDIYYMAFDTNSPLDVKVTNKNYNETWSQADENGNSYSGDIDVPSTVLHEGKTYTVKKVGALAFVNSASLDSVKLPAGIDVIEGRAFLNCENLKTVELEEGLVTIEHFAFVGCSSLASLQLPASLTNISPIGSNPVFSGCSVLNISAEEGGNFHAEEGVLFEKSGSNLHHRLVWVPEIKSGEYTVPGDTVWINSYAIIDSSLAKIIIPANVKYLLGHNFHNSTALTDLTLPWTEPSNRSQIIMEGNPTVFYFDEVDKAKITLHVPSGTKSEYEKHELWKTDFVIEED